MRRLAVAICNYNRRELALRCLEAVLNSSRLKDCRIFVVDNASTDGSAITIDETFGSRVRVIREPCNLGGSGGFHKAICLALAIEPVYILVLDSDCIVSPDTVSFLSDFLDLHPDFSVVGPKIYWPEPKGLVQEFGGTIDWKAAVCRGEFKKYDETVLPQLRGWREVDYIAACCLLVRSSTILKHGNIDPGHFLYFDDVEWQWRMHLGGCRIAVTAEAEAVHHCGAANKKSNLPTYYHWRNRLHFFHKYSSDRFREQTVDTILRDASRAVATCRIFSLVNNAIAIFEGVSDALQGRWGIKNSDALDFSLDPPICGLPEEWEKLPVRRVLHVLEDIPETEKSNETLILEDPFGKRLTAAQAWHLSKRFQVEIDDVHNTFQYLKRHSCLSGIRKVPGE